jgi:hypothetical protein
VAAQMLDPKQMSGIPRPVTDLPDHSISVRLIRGDLSNNIPNFPIELHAGAKVRTAKTDANGRAQFDNVPPGETVKAVAVVDGERLESQEFAAPAQGGVRLMLVATNKDAAARESEPTAPVAGQVVLGGNSRIIIEPAEEAVQVYYLLDIVNTARAPVNPPAPFTFDMPTGAVGTTLMEGSSPQASVNGPLVGVKGPFAPGRTLVQVASEIPASSGSLALTQRFPASLQQLAVVVKKVGGTQLTSPQLANQQEMTAEGETFIAATGGSVPANQPIVLLLDGIPHHSVAPRWTALTIAMMVVAIGVWASTRPENSALRAAERHRLLARREKLFTDLVRLERDHRIHRIDQARYASRREELVTALERVYGALDSDDAGPEPADRAA